MTSFQYIDFYDYPRCVVLDYRSKLILLLSSFDEELDDYPNAYMVYLLPPIVAAQLKAGSWKFLEEQSLESIGQIPIGSVKFDPSRRETDASILDDLIS